MVIPFRSIAQLAVACFLWVGLTSQSVNAEGEATGQPGAVQSEEVEGSEISGSEQGKKSHEDSRAEGDRDHSDSETGQEPKKSHGAEGEQSAGGQGHEEEGGSGMEFKRDLALWSLVTFLVFVFVLRAFAWGPLVDGLDNRESHFRSQLAEAEAARQQAQRMLQEHAAKLESVQDEVKAIIEEAKRDAEHTKNDIIETAQKEAKTTQDRAIHEIERSRDAALKELFDTLSSQVTSATEHVIGRSLDGDDQDRLINEALSQFSSQ